MKIVYVSVDDKTVAQVAEKIGDGVGKAFVELLFGPMIEKGSCKKVKK